MSRVIIYLVLFFSAYSCTKKEQRQSNIENIQAKPIVTDTANIDGVLFELINNNGMAELRVQSDSTEIQGKIKMSPPCYFVRYEKKLRKHQYPEIQVKASIMILGDIVSSKDNAMPNNICGNALQGVSLKNDGKVLISKGVMRTSHFCLDSWIDEKDFSGFSSGLYDKE